MDTNKIKQALEIDKFLVEEQTKFSVKHLKNLLNDWLEQLKNPSRSGGLTKGVDFLKKQQDYFDLLEEALEKIYESKNYPPTPKQSYIQQLCSQNNPYDFAIKLEKAVDGILHFENKLEPKETFLLHYFHRLQLEDCFSEKMSYSNLKTGRIWA